MLEFLWNLGSFIVALGLLVTVHEFGHFWVARKCGVKVEKFSVGFGKTLWRTHDQHGTEYVIALIPLGGYVKMLDERVDDVAEQDKQYAFNNKSVYQRIAIVAAGPIANFLFAIFAFYLMLLIGKTEVKPIIGDVQPNSIASQAGLTQGSEIIAINGGKTPEWQAVNMALVSQIGADEIHIDARQADTTYIKSHHLNTSDWQFEPSETSAMDSLGFQPYRPKILPIIGQVVVGGAAERAGLQKGDEVVAIDGEKIDGNWQQFVDIIVANPNKTLPVTYLRDGDTKTTDMLVGTRQQNDGRTEGYAGIAATLEPYPQHYVFSLQYGPLEAIPEAFTRTWELIDLSFAMLAKLVTGDVSVNNLSGPIAIAQGAGNSAGVGLVYFLGFLALISINLGIINLLPLPILDGGHLLYYTVELITGKPVPEKVQEVGFKIGALILLTLMSIAIFNDVSRL